MESPTASELSERNGINEVPETSDKAMVSSMKTEAKCSLDEKESVDQPCKAVQRKAGYAHIKEEFLLPDHKPVLNLEYVSSEVKEKMHPVKSDESNVQQSGGKHAASEETLEGEPPEKKSKLKGRNKKRPRADKIQSKDRLCPAIKGDRECRFGDKCKFRHDKKGFLEEKLPDLDGLCPNFSKFGFCEYSIACRFAKNHLTDNLENVKNEELYEKTKSERSMNILNHDLRNQLWKRKFDFKRSYKAVKDVEKSFRGWDKSAKTENNTKAAESSVSTENSSSATHSTEINERTSVGPVMNTKDEESGEKTDSKLSSGGDTKTEVTQSDESTSKIGTKVSSEGDTKPDAIQSDQLTGETTLRTQTKEGVRTIGQITDEELFPLRPQEKKKIDFSDKLYLAPLTTVGNLPFRRVCKGYGADVTCGEMALATELLKGKLSEFSLIRRHPCEDIFGAQICGSYPDTMTKCGQLLTESFDLDFIDINCGCPIDMIYKQGAGSALMGKATRLEQICRTMKEVLDIPLTVKVRTGVFDGKNVAHSIIPRLRNAGVSLVTVHGRSREQRYTKSANWDYISQCASAGAPMPVFGNGDILSYEDANLHKQQSGVNGLMIARGALIKPWIFTEIKEQRHWDISSGERLDMLRSFSNYGLEHWGSDDQGVENTRRFLLEWLSFLHRYIPVGVLEVVPQKINERPPYYVGRNDLETLMASANCADWIKITEMLLGPVPENFKFLPKHKANAYQ